MITVCYEDANEQVVSTIDADSEFEARFILMEMINRAERITLPHTNYKFIKLFNAYFIETVTADDFTFIPIEKSLEKLGKVTKRT